MASLAFEQGAQHYLENLDLSNGRNISDKRHLLQKGLSQDTSNRYLGIWRLISQLFHKAVDWDWLVKVPTTTSLEPMAAKTLPMPVKSSEC
ncbi:hypothetical protein [Vampirovibrio sp.]|uniref:hypothetical protein n=1 Tax=Vampirovibrio sp. TaxID=2717857 RepID=UPI003593FA16